MPGSCLSLTDFHAVILQLFVYYQSLFQADSTNWLHFHVSLWEMSDSEPIYII